MSSFNKKLWVGILVLAVLAPIGLVLPRSFQSGDAWGEWGTETLGKLLGYVPEGFKRTADLWKAPVRDYNLGSESASLPAQSGYYILSAFIGIVLAAGIMYVLSRMLLKRK